MWGGWWWISNSIYEEKNMRRDTFDQPRKHYDLKQRLTTTGPPKGHLRLVPPADANIENIESSEWSDLGRDPRFVAGWWIIPSLIWVQILIAFLIAVVEIPLGNLTRFQ